MAGRPKLVPGEKGNYHVSRAVKAKQIAKKKLRDAVNDAEKKKIAAQKARDSAEKKKRKHAKTVDLLENGGVTDEDFLDSVPKQVREAIEQGEQELIFSPNPGPQTEFLASPEKEVLYGGAAGGGKSYALLVDPLRYADNKNFRGLLLRRTLGELAELIDQSKKLYPRAFPSAYYRESKNLWVFPSGATILLSYVDRDQDVTRYQGQAFSWIGVDELGHYPTPYVWDYLRSRLRTTDQSIETYMRASANPGGVGGWWIKKMFIDPQTPNTPFAACDMETGKPLRYPKNHLKEGQPLFYRKFVPARLTDNPYLMASGEYEAMLLSLPEVERRRLLEGDWDVAEGAAFAEFNRYLHVCDPFEIPRGWPRFRAADYGFSSPSCVLWGAVDHDGNIWIYRELYAKRLTADALADAIYEAEAMDPSMYTAVLDKSCWNKVAGAPSVAQTMITKGIRWLPSNSDRIAGKLEVHKRLQCNPETGEPRIKIFSTCTNLVRTLPTIPLSKTNSEDVDTKAEDHAYDALRYMCMTRQINNINYNSWAHRVRDTTPEPRDIVFGY
jgi:hypothetical protein